jgi:NOL1/NOP2/sun family putative RNA methylase
MDIHELCTRFGYREYMIERYLKLFGEARIIEFLEGNDQKLVPTIRVNTLRISQEELHKKLTDKGFNLSPIPFIPDAFYVKHEPFSIGATTEYLLGDYYIQGAASMIPSMLLKPNSQDLVVDMCAAPGGKTIQLAQHMRNEGILFALDLNRERMKSLRSNLARCGVKNVIAIRMDATTLGELKITGITKILLDAPCSGSGLIPSDPTRKLSRGYEDITSCSSTQSKLITAALNALEPGGELVYSTCSIEPEENEYIIDTVLNQFGVKLVDLGLTIGEPGILEAFGKQIAPDLKKARRLYPYLHQTEGFFVCKLKKVE